MQYSDNFNVYILYYIIRSEENNDDKFPRIFDINDIKLIYNKINGLDSFLLNQKLIRCITEFNLVSNKFSDFYNKSDIKDVKNKFYTYIKGFINNEFNSSLNYYNFEYSKNIFLNELKKYYDKYNKKFLITTNSLNDSSLFKDKDLRFLDILLSLEYLGFYTINSLNISSSDIDFHCHVTLNDKFFSNTSKENKINKQKIKIIEILKNERDFKVYINKDYKKYYSPNDSKNKNSYWENFYLVARDGKCNYDPNIRRWFNTNKTNPIYSKLNYLRTKILKKKRDNLISNEVKIKIKV